MTSILKTSIKTLHESLGFTPEGSEGISFHGADPILPTVFPIGLAGGIVFGALNEAVADLWYRHTKQKQPIILDALHCALALRADRYLQVLDGETPARWAPLSGFYRCKEARYIQLHCNFPHHEQGVLDYFAIPRDKATLQEAILDCCAETLETELTARGLCAAMVRTKQEWDAHPQAQSVAELPLVEITKIADSAPRALPVGQDPLSHLKVLDLTRVLAGPTAGRCFADFGAQVIRVANANMPSIPHAVMDTGYGKRSCFIDLATQAGKQDLWDLSKESDVFLQAYRPGSLAAKGFSPEALAEHRLGCVYVSVSAYGHQGPWANKRGYDTLVQSASGMALAESENGMPKHLPVQALDYLTGYLAAYATLVALKRRSIEGGSYHVQVSLAQTAHWLNSPPFARVFPDNVSEITAQQLRPLLQETQSAFGRLSSLRPVAALTGTPAKFQSPPVPLGSDPVSWN